jgi:aerobic carbon-monoxide dehydrogenase small subunit
MQVYKETRTVTFTINDRKTEALVRPGDTLLRVLRETIGLTGSKMGCENGDCGACTVLVDGKPVKSCYMLALDALGKSVTTIEGLDNTAIQNAFIEEYGFQCGFCTPGMIMNAGALLAEEPKPDPETVREWMESNLCRCTGYETIERAVERGSQRGPQDGAQR